MSETSPLTLSLSDNESDDAAFIARYGRAEYDQITSLRFSDGSMPEYILSYEDAKGVRGQTLVGPPMGPSELAECRPPYKWLTVRNVYTLRPAEPTRSERPA